MIRDEDSYKAIDITFEEGGEGKQNSRKYFYYLLDYYLFDF